MSLTIDSNLCELDWSPRKIICYKCGEYIIKKEQYIRARPMYSRRSRGYHVRCFLKELLTLIDIIPKIHYNTLLR